MQQAIVMRTRTFGGPDAAHFIERRSMKFGRGFEHRMIGRRALSSRGCQNQNAGDLRGHLP